MTATPMTVRMERDGPIDVIRYSGNHYCDGASQEAGERVTEYLDERIREGRSRFLADIRSLYIFYWSGFAELVNTYSYIADKGAQYRVAILWDPIEAKERRNMISRVPFAMEDRNFFFQDQKAATAFLLSDEAWELST